MKKLMAGSLIAMAAGAGMMAYALNSKSTKKKASKLVNNAMDMANNKINAMK
ncbi:unknown [Mycoplasma sp. CAG:776]|nr:unknown [Mycoplasma sp. CAG:776]